MAIIRFIKDWSLVLAIIVGIAAYFIYAAIPSLNATHAAVLDAINVIQPILIFLMLFITFCKVEPSDLKLTPWQPWLLLLQISVFLLGATIIILLPTGRWSTIIECAMLCMICPTATAAAVVTAKLQGNAGSLTAYTILINLATAIIVPAVVPLIHPAQSHTFIHSFLLIISRVFPLLFGPFLLAMILRRINPRITHAIGSVPNLAFYLWAVALSLAIAITVKTLVHARCSIADMSIIALVSALACFAQFALGRMVGSHYGDPISAAQSCGQKNTVFAIWMGYTFLTPTTSLAGGFYCIWHNVYNSYQLYRHSHKR